MGNSDADRPKENRNVHIVSRPKVEIFIGKYNAHFLLVIWLIVFVFETFGGFQINFPRVSLVGILPMFGVLVLCTYLFFFKFAYKVAFDFNKQELTFDMFKKPPVKIRIEDIEKIVISLYVIFYYDGNTIYFKGSDNKRFMELVNEVKSRIAR